MIDFSLIQTGLPITAAAVQSPHIQALTQSGYRGDGLDFAGYVATIGGAMTGKLGVARAGVSGFDHALDISFDHVGGAAGGPASQLGHGINLAVTFTPATGTTRGMQSQKITSTIKGAGSGGGGIDGAGIDAMDLSTIIDASRTGTCALVMGISAAVSKFNTVDDSVIGGSLIAGQFVANLHAGKTALVGTQHSITADTATTATVAYGVQVLQPILVGGVVQTRAAAVYVDDWSAAGVAAFGATVPRGLAFYALGGDAVLHNGDVEVESSAAGLILKSANSSRYRVQVSNAGALTVAGPL